MTFSVKQGCPLTRPMFDFAFIAAINLNLITCVKVT